MSGLILAAPASGSGKTVLAVGLVHHWRETGRRVAAAKAGPDYIDPSFHAAASGRPCINLDPWAMRPATLARLVRGLEADSDLVVCEGVMGLFDGTGPDGETGSTAELARLTGWPVVLVVDARRQGASAAALVAGFARHDPRVTLAGVVFNRVAGARHRAVLETALVRHVPEVPCLGAVPSDPALALAERHLGLVPFGEARADPAQAAALVAAAIDTGRLAALARPSRLDAGEAAAGIAPLGQFIAVARDDAFVFAYPAVLDDWRGAGAELAFFSPLADEAPDPRADAVYLPGGYPELHAGRLAAAANFLAGLRRHGGTIYGECGGYMVLGDSLADAAGTAHRMAGLLPLATSFAARRLQLGYREAALAADFPLGRKGTRFRGHEFHYATTVSEGDAAPLFDIGGLRRGTAAGSFIHLIDRAD
jgi:cobyrinic acid a,c-diamide synthase